MKRLAMLLLVAAAGCGGDPKPVPLVGGVVDSFEDANELSALNQPWAAIADGGDTRSSVSVEPGGFGIDSKHYLAVRGVRPQVPTGSEVAGVRTSITQVPPAADPAREERPRDLSSFVGVSLALRGTPGTYIVQLGTASVDDFDYFNAYVELGTEWGEYRLPFTSFHQEGFGKPAAWTGRDVTHIAVYANMPGFFEFGVDDVRFHTR